MVSEVICGNESLRELIVRLVPGSRAEIIDVFTTALLGIAGVLGAAAGIQAVLRLRAEEAEGRAELLLATPRSRARWLGANLVLAAASVAVVALVAGTAATIGLTLSGGENGPPGLLVALRWRTPRPPPCLSRQRRSSSQRSPGFSIPLGWGILAGRPGPGPVR